MRIHPLWFLLGKLDDWLPLELLAGMAAVFASENILSILFQMSPFAGSELVGWMVVFILAVRTLQYWDDHEDEVQEEVEEYKDGRMDEMTDSG